MGQLVFGNAAGDLSDIKDWPSFFEQIRLRPPMWLGETSLLALRSLIDGIKLAETFHDVPESRAFGGFPFLKFERWVAKRFNPERLSLGSYSLARRAADSEEAAFHLWFGWYDRFRQERAV